MNYVINTRRFAQRNFTAAGLVLGLIVVPFVGNASPDAQNTAGAGYEIPLGELKKVKKDRPAKKESRERKKKKSEASSEQKTYGVVVEPEGGATSGAASASKNVEEAKPGQDNRAPLAIHHEPYSYVVTGKRSVIQAIISGTNSIQSAYCRFRSDENGSYGQVPMVSVPGTYFTYTATLPGLAPSSKVLRYSIVAVDSAGNEIKSTEFLTTVKVSTVLPGWQVESSPEVLKIKLENKERPLEGFLEPNVAQ
jgi:hypothetical protein